MTFSPVRETGKSTLEALESAINSYNDGELSGWELALITRRLKEFTELAVKAEDDLAYSNKIDQARLAGMTAFLDGEPQVPPAEYDFGCQEVWKIGWDECQREREMKEAIVLAAVPIEALLFAHQGTNHLHPETMSALRTAALVLRAVVLRQTGEIVAEQDKDKDKGEVT